MHTNNKKNQRSRTLALSLALLLSVFCLSACGSTPTAAETGVITEAQQEEGLSDEEAFLKQPMEEAEVTAKTVAADNEQSTESAPTNLHSLFQQAAGDLPEIAFYQEDFDADGTEEAFGIAGQKDDEGLYFDTKTYFITSSGEVSLFTDGLYGYGQPGMFTVSGHSFVDWFNCTSPAVYGGDAVVFGVWNGEPYYPIEDYQTSTGDIILGYSASQTPGEVSAETYGFTDDGFREFRSQDYLFDMTTGKFVEK